MVCLRIKLLVKLRNPCFDGDLTMLFVPLCRPIGERSMRGRGGPRGGRGGRGRGMGRNDGFDSRGKREFDRHSGSDRS